MKKRTNTSLIFILVLLLLFSAVPSVFAHTIPDVTEGYQISCSEDRVDVFSKEENIVEIVCVVTGTICTQTELSVSFSVEVIAGKYVVTETCKGMDLSAEGAITGGSKFDLYLGYCGAFLSSPWFDGSAKLSKVFAPPTGLNFNHYGCQVEYFKADGTAATYTGTFGYVYFNLNENEVKAYEDGSLSIFTHDGSAWKECAFSYFLPNEGTHGRLSCLTNDTLFAIGGK